MIITIYRELLAVHPKTMRRRNRNKKTRMVMAKLFALEANAIKLKIPIKTIMQWLINLKFAYIFRN